MTNKDLSRKLSEICGIEGKWVEYTTEITDGCVNSGKKRVYPDFTQPENFVILQKKLIQELGMGFDIQLWDYPSKL